MGASSVDVLASGNTGPVVITYAARHPDLVRRLVLGPGGARNRDYRVTPKRWAATPLIEVDWELYIQTLALIDFGWTELGKQIAEANKGVVTGETFLTAWRAGRDDDVWDLLRRCVAPHW